VSELTSVLPAWVAWAGPLLALTTVIAVSVVLFVILVRGSLRSAAVAGEWTERARQVHVARVGAAVTVVVLPVIGVMVATAFVGPLATVPRFVVAVTLVILGAGLGLRQSATVDRFVHGQSDEELLQSALGVVISYSPLLALIALGWFAPSQMSTWIIVPWSIVVCGVVYVWLRAPLLIAKTPLAQEADDRTSAIVDRAAESLLIEVDRVIEFRTRQPNAFAFPWLNLLAFTTGLLSALDDDELEAITHHELAHLAESAGLTRLRQAQLYALVPIVATRPILGTFGLVGPLAALLAFVAVTEVVRRRGLAAEHASDSAAIESIHHSDVYGRALEKTYRIGLIPAVLRRSTHGQLHERLSAAGVEPDFEPPLPPSGVRPLVAMIGVLVVVVVAVFSPWLVYATADSGSLAPTQLSAALPIYGSDPLETLAVHAEFDERWATAALLYGAAADLDGDDPYLRSDAVRMWAYAGHCDRAADSAKGLDPTTHLEDRRYADEFVEWCEVTGGLTSSG
jgi:Zn-dependent protease with chaperone function